MIVKTTVWGELPYSDQVASYYAQGASKDRSKGRQKIEYKRYWEKYDILGTKKIILAGINFDEKKIDTPHGKVLEVKVSCVTKEL